MIKKISHWSKFLFPIIALFLFGCGEENICNMTPGTLPQNPSNMYTITMSIRGNNGSTLQKSIRPYIIIGGEKHEMQKHPDGNNVFVYDHKFSDTGMVPYYFEVTYETQRNKKSVHERAIQSKLYHMTIVSKYIVALSANRGPVGSKVSILGGGFDQNDRVRMGKQMLSLDWKSSEVVEFTVPSVECDQAYEIVLLTNRADHANRREISGGTFFVDGSTISCSCDSIHLDNGESQQLVFMLDHPAPDAGVNLEITTDISESVIMPEVRFGAGKRTVNANISGSQESAKGMLFVNAKGFSPLEIPIEVGDVNVAANAEEKPSSLQRTSEAKIDNDVVVL